jgi:CubicO group peptidase (beta-lactamase class C family)
MRFCRILAAGVLLLVGPVSAQQGPLRGLDAYVAQALQDWEAPGVAVAVVRNDSVVLARGYGVRQLGRPDPVTEHSLFAIGSTSKAFTSALLGMLVDEKKIRWDDPVTLHLPGFQLYDPYVTRELTIRDLLTHRSGLTRGDRLWASSGFSREQVLQRVRYLKPSWSLRSRYGYQNIMYLAAGELAGRVMGQSWDDAVRERIFTPLGMRRTVTSVVPLARMEDVATPHERIDGQVTPVEWMNIDNIGPAGSINSSVAEMAQWIRLHLGQGTWSGRKLIDTGTVKEMHTIQMHLRPSETDEKLWPESHLMGYGLAWSLRDYRGVKLVSHGGAIRGMRAWVGLVPERRLGVVVLTNLAESSLPTAIAMRAIDQHLGAPVKDWSKAYLAEAREGRERMAENRRKTEAARVANTSPSLPLDRYASTYADSMYGEIRVVREAEKLVMHFGPQYVGDLQHWHFNTFEAVARNRVLGRRFVNFRVDHQGQVVSLEIPDLATFTRVPGSAVSAGAGNR